MSPHPAAQAGPITEVAAALGLEVVGRKARCYNAAAHKSGTDETPALVFFPDTNRFQCFACGVSGDAIDLVKAVRKVAFRGAVEFLLGLGASGPAGVTTGYSDRQPGARVPDDHAMDVYVTLFELSHDPEPGTPGGAYLQRRGIGVGLASRLFVTELDNPKRVWRKLIAEHGEDQVRAAGLASRAGGFLFARHALLFFYSADNYPQFVQARDITGEASCKELSLAGLHSPVPYNVDVLRQGHDRVLVCEGCIDTLSAEQLGHPAVGVPGATGFRDAWFPMFDAVRRITILFDDDPAGRRQGAELRTQFRLRGIRADAQYPCRGKDVNDLLLTLACEEDRDER
jgi:DNA primase